MWDFNVQLWEKKYKYKDESTPEDTFRRVANAIGKTKEEKEEKRLELYFHKRLMNDTLPLSIGGGIGQSRLCMFYLRKAHIGEIQASIWPEDMRKECEELEIHLI